MTSGGVTETCMTEETVSQDVGIGTERVRTRFLIDYCSLPLHPCDICGRDILGEKKRMTTLVPLQGLFRTSHSDSGLGSPTSRLVTTVYRTIYLMGLTTGDDTPQ